MRVVIEIPDAIVDIVTQSMAAKVSDRNDLPGETTQEKAIRRIREVARQDVIDTIRIKAHEQAQASINQIATKAQAAMDAPENYVKITVE